MQLQKQHSDCISLFRESGLKKEVYEITLLSVFLAVYVCPSVSLSPINLLAYVASDITLLSVYHL
jgi:hypothetical protein